MAGPAFGGSAPSLHPAGEEGWSAKLVLASLPPLFRDTHWQRGRVAWQGALRKSSRDFGSMSRWELTLQAASSELCQRTKSLAEGDGKAFGGLFLLAACNADPDAAEQ